MRLAAATLSMLAFTACLDPDSISTSPWGGGNADGENTSGPFAFEGSMWEARGLGFEEDGSAQVGMGGNTCDIEPSTGSFENDLDVVTSVEDEVVDVSAGRVLVLGGGRVNVFVPTSTGGDMYGGDVFPAGNGRADITTARLYEGGVVALRDTAAGCFVEWSGRMVGATAVPACGDIDVDRATGTVFLAHGEASAIVSPGRVIALPGGDRVAWMAEAGQVVIARAGTGDLAAFAFDGEEADAEPLWVQRLAAPVEDVAALDGRSFVLNHPTTLVRLDVAGAELGRTEVRNGQGRLATSADGAQVAIVRGVNGARVYRLRGE
jgi:hypothetical protein